MAPSPDRPDAPMRIAKSTATRLRAMALAGAAAALGAWIAPFGSAVAGALAGGALAGAFRSASPGRPAPRDASATRVDDPAKASPPDPALLNRLPLAFLLLDRRAQVVFCSAEARGLLAREAVGRHVSAVFRAPMVLAAIDRALDGGADESFDFTALRPRKRTLRASVRALSGLASTNGISTGEAPSGEARIVLALQDVSQVHRLDAMRMDFVANASHELRTPLAAIGGMVETLQGPARDDVANRDRFLAIIAREAARMARLVDDLLSLSRIELQANIAPTAREDLRPLIAEAVSATAPLAAENGNDLRVALGEGSLVVRGDRDELLQVFHNLISNAIRYGGADRPIDILRADGEGGGEGGRVGISVRDYGEGIEATLVPRLTERFFRVNKRESVSRGGTGLGLAIVKHILTRHGGDLRIASTVGEGSTFTVRLPRA